MALDRRKREDRIGQRRRTVPKRDPFDFDAPRFTDFCKPKYREAKMLLDQVVLKQMNIDENMYNGRSGSIFYF